MSIKGVTWTKLPSIQDARGYLTAIEGSEDIPFQIQRVFYMHGVVPGADRGGHAHMETDQLAVAVSGSLRILVSDGHESRMIMLENPEWGIFIPQMIWIRLMDFSSGAVCLVLADTHYDMSKSIRSWPEYLLAKGLSERPEPVEPTPLLGPGGI